MPSINFFEEDINFRLKDKNKVKNWVKSAIQSEGFLLGELNYIFCSDSYLLQINQQYLNHDTYTDIVTFDNSEEEKEITGDIFISIERVRENAFKFNSGEMNELLRVIIHGSLHLMGYKDKNIESKKIMTGKEDHYLSLKNFT
ncbi:MAG: rRNA maturation RNase YbeY [Mucilaginibacter sp.]